jgi:hypothetical protein
MEQYMMIKRFLCFAALAVCACFGPSAFALERPVSYLAAKFDQMPDTHLTATARLELTLAQWREGSEAGNDALSSNLRASSNHFIMASVNTPDEPGVDLT